MKAFLVIAAVVVAAFLAQKPQPINDVKAMLNILHGDHKSKKLVTGDLKSELADYEKRYGEHRTDAVALNEYYNLVTDYYEYGWGRSFHFAHTMKDEGFDASLQRHANRVADLLGVKTGAKVLEVGCGIGGAAMQVAARSGASVNGVTVNAYQAARAKKQKEAYGKADKVDFAVADFNKLDDADNFYDAAYAIESTSHVQDLAKVYSEVARVLKPGAKFVVFEWLKTPAFNPKNATHAALIKDIEHYNGAPVVRTKADVETAAASAGLTILSFEDLAEDKQGTKPWYHRLEVTSAKKSFAKLAVYTSELVGASPAGSYSILELLFNAQDSLFEAGEEGIFSPLNLFIMQKPFPALAN